MNNKRKMKKKKELKFMISPIVDGSWVLFSAHIPTSF
jgi:hypothetical protein